MRNVTKLELVNCVADKTGLTKVDVLMVFKNLTQLIQKNLIQGNKVFLKGFAVFKPQIRKARIVRNPKNRKTYDWPGGGSVKCTFPDDTKQGVQRLYEAAK